MEGNFKDRATVPIPPPLFFFACLGVSLLLEYVLPFRLFDWSWTARIVAGGFFILISGALAMGAFKVLSKNKTPFDPSKPTTKIVREGSYRFSRNPLYLALLLLLSGIAILSCSFWLFLSIPVLFIILKYLAVSPEERYLLQKFGEEYLDYEASVRRWI